MSPEQMELSIRERRERLERRANVIRSRLLRTIDALDVRRHQVTEIGGHVKRLALPVGGVVVGVALLVAGTTFAIGRLLKRRKDRLLSTRFKKWLAPMVQPPKPSLLEEVVRKLTLTFVGIVGGELARRASKNVFDGRMPSGHLLTMLPEPAERTRRALVRAESDETSQPREPAAMVAAPPLPAPAR
jgi:hypothetical protein